MLPLLNLSHQEATYVQLQSINNRGIVLHFEFRQKPLKETSQTQVISVPVRSAWLRKPVTTHNVTHNHKLFSEKLPNCNSFLLIMSSFAPPSKKAKRSHSNKAAAKSDGDFFPGKVRCALISSLINFSPSGFRQGRSQ